jgi:hypothetical protein
MAKENPTDRGAAVALSIPADQVRFLRDLFQRARAGVREELREHPGSPGRAGTLRREDAAYGRLLAALDECVIVPDTDLRVVVGDLAKVIDISNEYSRVVSEHEALHDLLGQIGGGQGPMTRNTAH